MKCPVCKSEEFIHASHVPLHDGENFLVSANNAFVCKCCGYVLLFDDTVENVHKGCWPQVEEDE